jgi:uncharacterized membrane protein YfcA
MAIVGLLLAALMGISLGLIGGGGSILAVPILKYVVGFGAKEAIASSLAVVGLTSLFAAIGHWRAGNVNLRVALTFGAVAMVGTYLGARLAAFFSGAAQLALFAVVMLVAAYFMFRENGPNPAEDGSDGDYSGKRMSYGLIVVEGLTVGVLTGLVGVGGGFLIVPALVVLGKVPMKEAVGTSLLIIAMKSASGLVGYVGQVEVRWGYLTLFTAVAIAGSLGGTYLVRYVPQEALKKVFAAFLVVMGVFILYQNRGAVPFL